ncbi:ral GTPase-activating protein subunit alpha-1 isoform X5 [Octopus sinensis]|uniref:Ral GTPase-activating protein subunit alpha-1 isoform X5 n=1 Tax=Octopus sinensis TaxID=2607531 RepID=A0A7E6F987_9MOLL|nr:ral GTPase-activating protein subunit alpha-1 isoform X5 [Octopus sinensis]
MSALYMFRKAAHGDIKKSAQKVLDNKKDPPTRLKHLRVLLDYYDIQEQKGFFEENFSHIYYIFYDVFVNVETELKQRASKSHREELEAILQIFEKILVLLPEKIHKKWMFHNIGRIMKKLLHPKNGLKLRREGMRLFIIWYQILQENASEECHNVFLYLVPGLSCTSLEDVYSRMGFNDNNNDLGVVSPGEISPILPAVGEKLPENTTKFFLDAFLAYLVSEVIKVEWLNKSMRETSFVFLFDKFKSSYLKWLLPDFDFSRSIYDPPLELPKNRRMQDLKSQDRPLNISECRDSFVRWLSTFVISTKRTENTMTKGLSCSLLTEQSHQTEVETCAVSEPKADSDQLVPGSAASTLSTGSQCTDNSTNSSIYNEDHSLSEYEIVKSVLFSTRENVNVVHEAFRQALLFSFNHALAMRRVIAVYKDWFQQHAEELPVFMQEPVDEGQGCGLREDNTELNQHSLSDIMEEDESPASSNSRLPLVNDLPDKSHLRNASYLGAIQELADRGEQQNYDVRAGLQKVLQVFITNAANIFLLEAEDDGNLLLEQVDLCKRVLNIYRHIILNIQLAPKTWEQTLLVLLCVTSGVLKKSPPTDRFRTLGGKLVQPIFQTLIVTWIKANLSVYISADLWHQLLDVLSSLTSWDELIKEWSKTINTLTRVLARQVYNLDMHDLPLDRLTEQKEKKRRGKIQDPLMSCSVWNDLNTTPVQRATHPIPNTTEGPSRSKSSEQNVSRACITSDSGLPRAPSVSSSTPDTPFDRGKFKSEGAGGLKSRTELHKQRSLSGEPSPCHSRTASVASDSMIRSSSEGNLADPRELAERLKGASCQSDQKEISITDNEDFHTAAAAGRRTSLSGGEDQDHEVAVITTTTTTTMTTTTTAATTTTTTTTTTSSSSSTTVIHEIEGSDSSTGNGSENITCTALLPSTDSMLDAISLEKSDLENSGRLSRTPSIMSIHSKSDSRSQSPTSELAVELNPKDSPTPDRDSLHIDVVAGSGADEGPINRESIAGVDNFEEYKSVLAGGYIMGWTPDVAVVLWRRMLGVLGNVNEIESTEIHTSVYKCLQGLMETMIKMRENLGVTLDNQCSPAPPELIPPLAIFSSWLFECLQLPNRYKNSKLIAYQLLCQMFVRRDNTFLPLDSLTHFYQALHLGLVSQEQDMVNVLVKHCGPWFFSAPLPGSTLLILDSIHAAGTIISSSDPEVPKTEAVALLGALICFPNHFGDLRVLQPKTLVCTQIAANEFKDLIVDQLLKAGKLDSVSSARCIALSSLGIFLYEELVHGTLHPKIKEAINVLLGALKCSTKMVAKVASDMLMLLCDHVDTFLSYLPDLPKKIIEAIALTVTEIMPSPDQPCNEDQKRLLESMLFTTVEWCMQMPMHLLLEPTENEKPLLHKVFQVLNAAVTGQTTASLSRGSHSFSDFVSEMDMDREALLGSTSGSKLFPAESVENTNVENPKGLCPFEAPVKQETDILKLAAKTLMTHLVNHLSHFPMGDGAAKLSSCVQEHHDLPEFCDNDLKPEIFQATNVQFFVLNHQSLISFVELPALSDSSGRSVTAGLTTAKTVCRVIIRDLSGKYCWENSVLYGPPWYQKDPTPQVKKVESPLVNGPSNMQFSSVKMEAEPHTNQENCDSKPQDLRPPHPEVVELPEGHTPDLDNLDQLLRYIGYASPECLLMPGVPLNIAAPIPEKLSTQAEEMMTNLVLQQKEAELDYYYQHKSDPRRTEERPMVANPQMTTEIKDPVSPFQISRSLLDQMGLLSWERRCHFDLLKKSDKLLRELKNLDSQKCRDTHKVAVIYVAEGQEDKHSILANCGGSKAYEDFVSGLGWEVDLEQHVGFLGGLQQNKTTGETAPYYANSTCEVIYHVSTRMPTGNDAAMHIKMRHLGNDEVHIVWSEHSRDYRRNIIPTEFGDILIIIYPLPNGLFRIHINKKPDIHFGPLFDGAIVNSKVLPCLVRATAINASRTKRALMPLYHSHYEERAKCLGNIIQKHIELTMFEDFAANVFAPVFPDTSATVDQPTSATTANAADTPAISSSNSSAKLSSASFSPSQVSARQSRGSDSVFETAETFVKSTAKRLSLKRKCSISRVPTSTPPGSPTVYVRK